MYRLYIQCKISNISEKFAYKIESKSDITLIHLQKKDCIILAQLAFQQLFNNQKNGQHISKFRVSSAIVRIPDINQSRAIKA